MQHHLIAIELVNGSMYAIEPNEQELQALIDTGDFVVLDPLLNESIMEDLTREPIPTAKISQDGPIVQVIK